MLAGRGMKEQKKEKGGGKRKNDALCGFRKSFD
jgi:hypothetical protein